MTQQAKKKTFWGEVVSLVLTLLVVLGLRTFVAEPFAIPSGSMIPTMLIGDYLYVAKYGYGYSNYSFLLWPDLFKGRIFGREPERGEVVVFAGPPPGGNPDSTPETRYIKRLIGMPGDKIQVKRGILYINGKPCPQRRIEDYAERASTGRVRKTPRYIETLPNGVEHEILREDPEGFENKDNTEVFTVPENHYFMMGDNRNHSGDSRYSEYMGTIPYEQLIGPAKFVFFSIDSSILDIWRVWEWGEILRLDRVMKWIK